MKPILLIIVGLTLTAVCSYSQTITTAETECINALILSRSDNVKYYCQINNYALAKYLSAEELSNDPQALVQKLEALKINDSLRFRFYTMVNYYYTNYAPIIKSAFQITLYEKKRRKHLCSDEALNTITSKIVKYNNDYELAYNKQYNEADTVHRGAGELSAYPGGDAAMFKFIQMTINYPDYEKETDISGKVLLNFVIEKDGNISNVNIIKSVSAGLDNEAKRVVKLLAKFKPATTDGKAIRLLMVLPITFKLQ